MTINTWITANYSELRAVMMRICENDPLHEELLHHTLEILLTRKDRDHLAETGEAWYMCLRIATNNWKSTTSPFYTTYRQTKEAIENLPEKEVIDNTLTEEDLLKQVEKHLNTLNWYDKMLFKTFAELESNASLVARETRIPRQSISLTVKRVRTHLKKHIRYD